MVKMLLFVEVSMLRVLFSVRDYVLTIVCEYFAIAHTFHDVLTLRFNGFHTIAGHLCQLFMFSFDRFTALSCQRRHSNNENHDAAYLNKASRNPKNRSYVIKTHI